MTAPAQRFSAPALRRGVPGFASGRPAAIVLALAAVGILTLFPGNVAVALVVAVALSLGLCFAIGGHREADRESSQILEEHKLLVECVEGSPIPFAVYDQNDNLIVCNEPYEKLYGDVFDRLRRQNTSRRIHYADLVRGFSTGTVQPEEMDAYVEARCRAQRHADGTGVDRFYSGFGWLRVTKFATPSGAVAGFAVNINELKNRETALHAQIKRSKSLERKLRDLANTDSLTELPNRRAFFERLEAEFVRARRYDTSLGIIMMDIDRFKSINDIHGHSVGDTVIRGVATAAAAELRAHVDLIGRVGGEEFAILLPATDSGGARDCGTRMRGSIATLEFDSGNGKFHVTASFGVSTVLPDDRTHSECIARADAALYQAKTQGRNRVVVLTDVDRGSPAGS